MYKSMFNHLTIIAGMHAHMMQSIEICLAILRFFFHSSFVPYWALSVFNRLTFFMKCKGWIHYLLN